MVLQLPCAQLGFQSSYTSHSFIHSSFKAPIIEAWIRCFLLYILTDSPSINQSTDMERSLTRGDELDHHPLHSGCCSALGIRRWALLPDTSVKRLPGEKLSNTAAKGGELPQLLLDGGDKSLPPGHLALYPRCKHTRRDTIQSFFPAFSIALIFHQDFTFDVCACFI